MRPYMVGFRGSGYVATTLAHLLNVIETNWSQRLPKLRVKRSNVNPFHSLAGQNNTKCDGKPMLRVGIMVKLRPTRLIVQLGD